MMERQFGAFSEPGNGELWRSTDLFNCTVHVRNLEHERINSAPIELFCILSGPVGGIIFSFVCSYLSCVASWQWLELCSAVSLILSVFNLLPCKPLDGGRAFRCIAGMLFDERTADILTFSVGISFGGLLTLLSIFALRGGYGYGGAAAGICILLNLLCEEGIVKMS